MENERLVNKISETYLINKFADDEEKLKLRPTENNDKALKYLLRGDEKEEFNEYSRLIENFDYFKTRTTEGNYEVVLKGLNKLMFVEISLDREKDDPQRIFESLNSTGLDLTQADLIRNYILMDLNRKSQIKIYENYWEIIEYQAKETVSNTNRVSDFIRDFLTIKDKKIPNKNKVYEEFKSKYPRLGVTQLENILSQLKNFVKHYNKLINPSNEQDKDIQIQLNYINRLEINVAYPFILQVYDDFSKEKIDKNTFINVLELIQVFIWRRFIIGLPTNALNKIFMRLYEDVDTSSYLPSIQKALVKKRGAQRFPRDLEVLTTLKEKDVYGIKPKNRTYLLERLENHDNPEKVIIEGNQDITIEHIFPQNPDAKWKATLGTDDYNYIKENMLNTIGNLTLSGNNGKLGNKYFIQKRDMNINGKEQGYKYSRLWLNKHLAGLEKWGKNEIENRYNLISERFKAVWPFPNIELDDDADFNEINIFDAEEPKGKKLSYAILFDQKIELTKISDLYRETMKLLFDLQPQIFFTSELGETVSITKNPSKLRQPMPIDEIYHIEANLDSNGKFERIKMALSVYDCEDELLIKYADD